MRFPGPRGPGRVGTGARWSWPRVRWGGVVAVLVDGVVTTDLRMCEVHADSGRVRLEVEGESVSFESGAAEQLFAALGEALGRVRCGNVPVPR